MIGGLRRWQDCLGGYRILCQIGVTEINGCGLCLRGEPLLLNPSLLVWKIVPLSFFLIKCIWKPIYPSKVSFFLWTAYLDKILTLDHLKRRGWELTNRCMMCLE